MSLFVAKSAFAKLVPLVGSAALHVGVFASVAGGHGSAGTAARPVDALEMIDVQREEEPAPPPVQPAEPVAPSAPPIQTHTHPYPVVADHDHHAHAESVVHAPLLSATASAPAEVEAPAVVALDAPAASAAPRFTITLGGSTTASHGHVSAAGQGTSGARAASDPVADVIVPESGVSTRARLVAAASPVYPSGARSDEVESDVAVELVVDTAGRVTDAKLLTRAGHGFDESALEAVRRYRFSPAQRGGQAVRVRMRWVVQFRLR